MHLNKTDQEPIMDEHTRNQLMGLQEKWRTRASRCFADAKFELDPMGKRLIEHGAMCMFNCMMDVRRLLGLDLPGDPPGDVASSPHDLAESIGMAALSEAFKATMLHTMRGAISAGHEDTHLECLKEARLCVQRFHVCASALRQLAGSASTQ